jgi:hypothetical protein
MMWLTVGPVITTNNMGRDACPPLICGFGLFLQWSTKHSQSIDQSINAAAKNNPRRRANDTTLGMPPVTIPIEERMLNV